MKISMSFKNVKHSTNVDNRLEQKTYRLEKYLEGNFSVKWHCSFKEGIHFSEVYVSGSKFSFHASCKHENLYKSFDMTLDKIEKQVYKQKSKVKSRRPQHDEVTHLDPEQAWMDYDGKEYWENAS